MDNVPDGGARDGRIPTAIVSIGEYPFGDDIPGIHTLLSQRELGAAQAMIKVLRARMMAFYKANIAATSWEHSAIGRGFFDNGNKIRSSSANPVKIALISHLPEILESATYVEAQPHALSDERHVRQSVNIRQWHWLANDVAVGSVTYRVGLHVREDNAGYFHYNINPI